MTPMQQFSTPPDRSGLKTAMGVGVLVALVAANIYLFVQLGKMRDQQTRMLERIETELTNLKDTTTVTSSSARRNLDTLRQELATAREQAHAAASQVKTEALARTEQVARRLSEEQQKQAQALNSELTETKQAVSTANTKIGEVTTEVGTVKNLAAGTKSELDATISHLKKVEGDLGVQSGYIATNGKELAALKRLGERNYFEFNLAKSKQPQRVGDVMLLLKKTDQKRNKYTVEVTADDKKTEKKDKNINEPVQFYVSKARQPYELVVNEVKKDVIVGYLATPKDQVARN